MSLVPYSALSRSIAPSSQGTHDYTLSDAISQWVEDSQRYASSLRAARPPGITSGFARVQSGSDSRVKQLTSASSDYQTASELIDTDIGQARVEGLNKTLDRWGIPQYGVQQDDTGKYVYDDYLLRAAQLEEATSKFETDNTAQFPQESVRTYRAPVCEYSGDPTNPFKCVSMSIQDEYGRQIRGVFPTEAGDTRDAAQSALERSRAKPSDSSQIGRRYRKKRYSPKSD